MAAGAGPGRLARAALRMGSSLAMLALGTRFAALGAGLVDGGALAWRDWLVLGLVPLAAVLLAVLTARMTVLRTLGRML